MENSEPERCRYGAADVLALNLPLPVLRLSGSVQRSCESDV
jgi:hypothetical protein